MISCIGGGGRSHNHVILLNVVQFICIIMCSMNLSIWSQNNALVVFVHAGTDVFAGFILSCFVREGTAGGEGRGGWSLFIFYCCSYCMIRRCWPSSLSSWFSDKRLAMTGGRRE